MINHQKYCSGFANISLITLLLLISLLSLEIAHNLQQSTELQTKQSSAVKTWQNYLVNFTETQSEFKSFSANKFECQLHQAQFEREFCLVPDLKKSTLGDFKHLKYSEFFANAKNCLTPYPLNIEEIKSLTKTSCLVEGQHNLINASYRGNFISQEYLEIHENSQPVIIAALGSIKIKQLILGKQHTTLIAVDDITIQEIRAEAQTYLQLYSARGAIKIVEANNPINILISPASSYELPLNSNITFSNLNLISLTRSSAGIFSHESQ